MIFRLILASILSGFVLMAWGFYFWAFSPFREMMMDRVGDEVAVTESLKSSLKDTGNYVIPYPDQKAVDGSNPAAAKAFSERHTVGPLVQIIFVREGLDPTAPLAIILGFAHYIVCSLLAGILLLLARPGNYLARWLFVFLLGLFAAVTVDLAAVIWFHHPLKMGLVQMGFDLGCWFWAGMVLAALVWKREK